MKRLWRRRREGGGGGGGGGRGGGRGGEEEEDDLKRRMRNASARNLSLATKEVTFQWMAVRAHSSIIDKDVHVIMLV